MQSAQFMDIFNIFSQKPHVSMSIFVATFDYLPASSVFSHPHDKFPPLLMASSPVSPRRFLLQIPPFNRITMRSLELHGGFMKRLALVLASVPLGATLLALPGCPPANPAAQQSNEEALHGPAMDRAVVLLQLEARSKQPDIRANCVEALQPLSDDRSLDVIEQGLHDSDWVVRFASCMACGHRKVKTLLPVLQTMAVTDPNENVQVAAIYASARVGDTSSVGRLAETLASPDISVRANTALVLGLLGDKSAIPLLQSRANESEPRAKFEITAALARLGDPSGTTALVAFSVSKYVEDRIFAMATWPEIDNPDAADVLLGGLQDPMPGIKYPSRDIRLMSARIQLTAARGLAKLGNRIGRKQALSATEDSAPEIRALAALALGDILDTNEDGILVHMLTDPDERVRVSVAAAIINLHTRPETDASNMPK
jgi:HEAT repeat protein